MRQRNVVGLPDGTKVYDKHTGHDLRETESASSAAQVPKCRGGLLNLTKNGDEPGKSI